MATELNAAEHVDIERTTPLQLMTLSGVSIPLWTVDERDLRRIGARMVALMIERASFTERGDPSTPLTIVDQAQDMFAAIDAIEGALMGAEGFPIEKFETLWAGTDDEVVLSVRIKVGQMRRIIKALAECTRIVNSDQYNRPAREAAVIPAGVDPVV
jgi:hypothetical protein